MAFSVTCPRCRAVLRTAAPVPAGKKVKCPKCDATFQTPALEESTAVASVPVLPPPVVVAVEADEEPQSADDVPRTKKRRRDRDEVDDEPARVRKPKRKKGGMGVGMLVGLLVGGGFVLVIGCAGCGGLGYWAYTAFGSNRLVGTWEQTNHPLGIRPTITFQTDGRGQVAVLNIQNGFKYRFDKQVLEMEADQVVVGNMWGGRRISRFSVRFDNGELLATSLDIPNSPVERFRRVR